METAIAVEGVRKRFGRAEAVAGVDFEIREGEFFTMLGPSGCGKTTTLRMIAGFEQPDEGRILLRGEDVTYVPPNRRAVNMVFQHYALFPHMSIADNVRFGLKLKKVSRREQDERVAEILEVVGLVGLEKRKPAQLSGGQQQRVALARALVNRPAALLLDEPLGALDVKLRKQLQLELKRVQSELGTTFVYVTHDQEEALGMSDRIAVMNGGRVEQIGGPKDVYAEPLTAFVADFIGSLNALDLRVDDLDGELALMRLGENERLAVYATPGSAKGATVRVAVRPERIRVAAAGAAAPVGGSLLRGRIAEIVFLGPLTQFHVDTCAGRLVSYRMDDDAAARLREGAEVVLTWAPEHCAALAGATTPSADARL
jgi:spermidine/putrescine transport system ATP-binding protein